MKVTLLFLIEVYRSYFKVFFGYGCRYEPSCSEYGKQALLGFSLGRALGLIVARILRCNPFAEGGYDPLPSQKYPSCEAIERGCNHGTK